MQEGIQGNCKTGNDTREALEAGDYYYDGPYLVFTEQYHLRRGTCCDSGCRHCPYRSATPDETTRKGSTG